MTHERIYLQCMPDDGEPGDPSTWCRDRITPDDIEYVRADLLAAAQAEAREWQRVATEQAQLHADDTSRLEAEARKLREKLGRVRDFNVAEFVAGYELRGDEGVHVPTEDERFLLTDFAVALLEELEADNTLSASEPAEQPPYAPLVHITEARWQALNRLEFACRQGGPSDVQEALQALTNLYATESVPELLREERHD